MPRSALTPQAREASRNPEFVAPLTARQRKVAELVGRGSSWNQAAKDAGYAQGASNVSMWREDPRIQSIVEVERTKNEAVVNMDRKRVMEGFLEAVDIARVQADPATMIKAWAEVARMCGYYAPETRKIDISISAKRMVDKFETMSDEELLKYADQNVIDITPTEKEAGE